MGAAVLGGIDVLAGGAIEVLSCSAAVGLEDVLLVKVDGGDGTGGEGHGVLTHTRPEEPSLVPDCLDIVWTWVGVGLDVCAISLRSGGIIEELGGVPSFGERRVEVALPICCGGPSSGDGGVVGKLVEGGVLAQCVEIDL